MRELFLYMGVLYWTRADMERAMSSDGKYDVSYPEGIDTWLVKLQAGNEVLFQVYEIVALPPEPKGKTCESCYGFIPGATDCNSRCSVRRWYREANDQSCSFYEPKGTKETYKPANPYIKEVK